MTYIAFIPGLSGDIALKNFNPEAQPGTNYFAIQEIAQQRNIPCFRLAFQTVAYPFPKLSGMGSIVASQLDMLEDVYGAPGFIIAGSVGAGVIAQAFCDMKPQLQLPHVLAFKPVFNPLGAIKGALDRMTGGNGATVLDMVTKGTKPVLELPVEATVASCNPGNFYLDASHITDRDALRLLEDPTSFARLAERLDGSKMASLTIMYAQNDHVALQEDSAAFADAFSQHAVGGARMIILDGTHATDHTKALQQALNARLDLVLR